MTKWTSMGGQDYAMLPNSVGTTTAYVMKLGEKWWVSGQAQNVSEFGPYESVLVAQEAAEMLQAQGLLY